MIRLDADENDKDKSPFREKPIPLEQTCVVPGCPSKADKRYKATESSYYCEEHGKEVSRHDEAKKVEPL